MKTLKLSGKMVVIPIENEIPIEDRMRDELKRIWEKASNHERLSMEDCNRIRELINE